MKNGIEREHKVIIVSKHGRALTLQESHRISHTLRINSFFKKFLPYNNVLSLFASVPF